MMYVSNSFIIYSVIFLTIFFYAPDIIRPFIFWGPKTLPFLQDFFVLQIDNILSSVKF